MKLFAIMILDKKHEYPKYKGILTKNDVMSQVIQKYTCRKMNLSIGTNIMK